MCEILGIKACNFFKRHLYKKQKAFKCLIFINLKDHFQNE
jgi:hypothetical protein